MRKIWSSGALHLFARIRQRHHYQGAFTEFRIETSSFLLSGHWPSNSNTHYLRNWMLVNMQQLQQETNKFSAQIFFGFELFKWFFANIMSNTCDVYYKNENCYEYNKKSKVSNQWYCMQYSLLTFITSICKVSY